MFPYGETVTRQRGTVATDRYNKQTVSWADPDELSVEGCAFNPGGSTEPVEVGRHAIITSPTVYAPHDADIRASDRLVVRDATYEVVGHPAQWSNPFTGWTPGLVVELKRVEG